MQAGSWIEENSDCTAALHVFNTQEGMTGIIACREEVYAPQSQQTCYAGSKEVWVPGEAGDGATIQEVPETRGSVDEALCYILSAIFSKLHTLVENSQLYMLKYEELNDWPNVINCQFEESRLALCFAKVLPE